VFEAGNEVKDINLYNYDILKNNENTEFFGIESSTRKEARTA